MTQESIAIGYNEAIKLVQKTKSSYLDLPILNDKMWRVIKYLQSQAAEQLSCLRDY